MPHSTLATEERTASRWPRAREFRRTLAVAVAVWALVALLMALAQFVDVARAGKQVPLHRYVLIFLPMFMPVMLASTLLHMWLLRRTDLLDRPWKLARILTVLVLLFLLLDTPWLVFLKLLLANKELDTYWSALVGWPTMALWFDLIIFSGAAGAQCGFVLWRHSQVRQQALLQAQGDNLRLRLTLLQGQLEPHFMFNTLNSIAALVRGAERTVALNALTRLSELLRYSLRASQQQWVSVADELRFVNDYVALQSLRFGSDLNWQEQIESSDWARWACPPLLLQPLVENAIRYGLEAGTAGVPLRFAVRRHADTLEITIDNPRYADAALLAGHGVGLSKTRERLAMLYGTEASVRTVETETEFRLTLTLPLRDLDAALESSDR